MDIDLTTKRIKTLSVLQNVLSDYSNNGSQNGIVDILEETSHVAMYQFNEKNSKWDRFDVEGSAFITRNASYPVYTLIVLNKKGPKDFIIDLMSVLKLKIQSVYLMACCRTDKKRGKPVTFALWFHNEKEKLSLHKTIKRLLSVVSPFQASLQSKIKYVPSPAVSDENTQDDKNVNNNDGKRLLNMLKPLSPTPQGPVHSASSNEADVDNLNNSNRTDKVGSLLQMLCVQVPPKLSTPTKKPQSDSSTSPTSYATYLSVLDKSPTSSHAQSKGSATPPGKESNTHANDAQLNSPHTTKLKSLLSLKPSSASSASSSSAPCPPGISISSPLHSSQQPPRPPHQQHQQHQQQPKDRLFSMLKSAAASQSNSPPPSTQTDQHTAEVPIASAPLPTTQPYSAPGEFLTDVEISKANKLKKLLAVKSSSSANMTRPPTSLSSSSSSSSSSSLSSSSSTVAQQQAIQLLSMFKAKEVDKTFSSIKNEIPAEYMSNDKDKESIIGRRSDSPVSDGGGSSKSKARLISPSDLLSF